MKKFALIIIVFAFVDASAQVTIESVLTEYAKGGEILIVDQTIYNRPGESEDLVVGNLNFVPPHELKLNLPIDTDGRYIIDHKIQFVNCTFPENFILSNFSFQDSLVFKNCSFNDHVILRNLKSETIYFLENRMPLLIVDSIMAGRFILDGDEVEYLVEITSSVFNTQLSISIESPSFELIANTVNIPEPSIELSGEDLFYSAKPTFNVIEIFKGESIGVDGNKILGSSLYDIFRFYFPDAIGIAITDNSVEGLFQLQGKSEDLQMYGNDFKKIDFKSFTFPEFKTSIVWDDISGNALANAYGNANPERLLKPENIAAFYEQMNFRNEDESWLPRFYFGESDKELLSKWFFDQLSADYYRVYLTYKAQGRIEDANSAYVEMKDLRGRRLKALYHKNTTFKNYLKWKLNQLLKLYTEHGTEPIKAVLISFYIIIFFGLFYFLFPSSWDEFELNKKTWKSQGLKRSIVVGVKHLFNSQILSLNAFVTLGFGNIPTEGIPRYICVIEGFIGWFLLSLFTVALINQTLF